VPGSRQPPPQQPGTENSSGPPAGPHIEEPATRRLVERFAAAIPAVAAAHAAHVRRTVPAYARHDQKDTVVGDVAANTRQTYELLVRALHGDPVRVIHRVVRKNSSPRTAVMVVSNVSSGRR